MSKAMPTHRKSMPRHAKCAETAKTCFPGFSPTDRPMLWVSRRTCAWVFDMDVNVDMDVVMHMNLNMSVDMNMDMNMNVDMNMDNCEHWALKARINACLRLQKISFASSQP